MQSDPVLFDKFFGLFLSYWPHMGLIAGPILIITSRFRWRVLLQSLGVVILGISIGALVSRN